MNKRDKSLFNRWLDTSELWIRIMVGNDTVKEAIMRAYEAGLKQGRKKNGISKV